MRVRGIRWSSILAAIFLAVSSGAPSAFCQTSAPSWPSAVERAAREVPEARIVVLDIASGHLLAAHQLNDASRTLAAPGSTLKPLVLYALVSAGRWNPANRIACNRQLVVAGHRLACTHPPAPPFDAREALTWSCNTYFAAVARTLHPGELGQLLRPTGLLGFTGLARSEAVAEFREPDSDDAKQLTLLGVEGVRVTPLELAEAYRWLAMEMAAHPDSGAAQVVRAGLEDSASFGMAGQASLGGVAVMGKTGTAEGVASSRTHGWFIGLAPAEKPRVVIAVYLPSGRGADAAHIAGEMLANGPLRQP
jgi:cell division protein FtsI/penicillin-binding protein 2